MSGPKNERRRAGGFRCDCAMVERLRVGGLDGEVVERTKECYASFELRGDGDGDWGYRGAKIATKTMNGT